ncbi:hypothetical protein [Ramlibacter pallidus]|uniref:Uncharacterized protein n=1 Tax=Ramlibacter pallidus TaxID=2780087 RepID=A0ABR9S2M2_9BURK|nr:hypothetical protein [Ramlibacter pallidus]MBE7367753.1 hypothetical protein [Ramlibacter pallidus]
MKKLLTPRRNLVLVLCVGAWTGWAAAQSLGAPAAEAWIGRPLDMTVPARFLSPDAECVHADVFYGENRLRSSQVRASVTGGDAKRIRIQADALIDEPIVTVSVRAGCGSSITRNYTLLPELPSESVIAAWNRQAAAVAAAPAAPLRMANSAALATSPRVRAPRPAAAQVAAAPAPSAPAPRSRAAEAPRQEAAAGPRLRLEPLEFDQQPLLRVSSNLADPAGNAAGRATAALLWQAINADPQEILRTSAMLQKLETDLLQLRRTNDQTRAEMAALRSRLDEAQPWHASPVVAQVLALLVLAAATAAGVLWFRGRREEGAQASWYAQAEPAPAEAMAEVPAAAPPQHVPVHASRSATPDVPTPPPAAVPARGGAGPIEFEAVVPVPRPPQRRPAVMRVETLAATFEEAEFLASLGLGKDAMDVLKAYLQDSASPAPVAFFELMRLCEQAGEPAAVAMVRRRYEKAFGLEPPPLERLAGPAGLESLPRLSARITQAWGRPEVLDILEEALFHVPEPEGAFTLQAGRELISLHGLAVALAEDGEGAPVGHEADPHPLAPWAHADDTASALAATQGSVGGEGGHHFALDFDLGTAAPEAAPQAEGPRAALPLPPSRANASREAARRTREQEDAFSEAMHGERVPVSRF